MHTSSIAPSPTAAPIRSRLLALLASIALLTPGLLALDQWAAPAAQAGVTDEQLSHGGVLRDSHDYRVAPGLELTTFCRLEDKGWNEGSVLTADLRESTLSMDVADTGTATGNRAPVTEIMRKGPNGSRAVAAVNGTFFDMNRSDAPIYTTISREGGIRVGNPSARPALTVAEGKAAIQMLGAGGTVTLPGGDRHELGGINIPNLGVDKIGVYDHAWGDYTLDRPVSTNDKPSAKIARATVVDGTVTKVSGLVTTAGAPDIADGEQVLLGREAGADAVAKLRVGDRVELEVAPTQDVEMAIAGSHQILHNGYVITRDDDRLITDTHPRTVVGLSRDGAKMFVLVVDGRSASSRGMSLPEAAQLMKDMGAYQALNLDGGGSSTMTARVAGDDGEKIWNSPSDGAQRPVPDALVFYSDAPAEKLADVQVSTAIDQADTVFPGMHRTVEATGLAADLSPVLADGSFTADGGLAVATADATRAQITGDASGTVTYSAGGHRDRLDLRVLGDPVTLRPSERTLSLADADTTRTLTLTGTDADGHSARIETADATVTATSGFSVQDDELGTWKVRATGEQETGSVTFAIGDLETVVPVSFGTREQTVLDFADPSAFTSAADRATGSFAAAEGPDGSPAIGMTYDFTASASTRGFYLVPNEPVTVDGDALSFTMDVRGDKTGVWPRLQVQDAAGTVTNLDGDHVTFDGWQQVRFTVPAGLPQPLTVQRVRMLETRPEAQYTGDIAVANLRAVTTPTTDAAPEQSVHDAALLANGTVADRPQRIAVMSDAQFVGRDPNSAAVEGARRTLREIRAAKPDLLVIDGDFVDEASAEDFDLAQRVLDEEWDPAIPFIYVPGNHEVMGGTIDEFEKRFGPARTSRDLGRTRVLTLDSSAGSLGKRDTDQIAQLERELDEVAKSDTLTGITVFFHHPPTDPLPAKTSQLGDQREARAIEKLLGDFRRESGKSAAVINGHVGAFHGAAVDGVTYLINGNAGKSPAGTPSTGGFTGWTMLGISPGDGRVGKEPTVADRVQWLAAETHPRVDELTIDAPGKVRVGQSAPVAATFTQGEQVVPVAWPVTAQWGGDGVLIEDGADDPSRKRQLARPDAVVRLNPRTGELTALRPGSATVRVTVNGRSAAATVTVPGKGKPEKPGKPGKPGKPEEPGKPGKPGKR